MGFAKGNQSGTSQTTTGPPGPVMQDYYGLLDRANAVGSQPYQQYQGNLLAGFSPDQLAAFQSVNNAQGSFQPYMDAARGYATFGASPIQASAIQNYSNPYQQMVTNATLGNINQMDASQQAQLLGRSLGSGGLFNDRTGVAQSNLAYQQDLANNQTFAGLNAQNYNQALAAAQADRAAAGQAAYTFGNLGQENLQNILTAAGAQLGTGGQQQQQAQKGLDIPYMQWQQQQAFPYQQLSWLSGIETGVGSNLGGVGTTTTTPPMASQIAPYLGLGLLGLGQAGNIGSGLSSIGSWLGNLAPAVAMAKRGGRIERDAGGGIPGMGGGISPFPYAGVTSYVPAMPITPGKGAPSGGGGSGGAATNPINDAIKEASALNSLFGGGKKSGSSTFGDADPTPIASGTNYSLPGDVSAPVDQGGLGGLYRAGGPVERKQGGIYLPRRGYEEGGAPVDFGNAFVPDFADRFAGEETPARGTGFPSYVDFSQPGALDTGSGKPSWAASVGAEGVTPSAGLRPGEFPPATNQTIWPDSSGAVPTEGTVRPPSRSFPEEPAATPIEGGRDIPAPSAETSPSRPPRPQGGYGTTVVPIEAAKAAISHIESGGRYDLVGPMTHLGRALGKYQVMEAELPGQLREAGLPPMTPQEFLRNPQAQEQLFGKVFGNLMNKTGSFNDAAGTWFAGPNWRNKPNVSDAFGTTPPAYLRNANAALDRAMGSGGADNPTFAGGIGPERGQGMGFVPFDRDSRTAGFPPFRASADAEERRGPFGMSSRAGDALTMAGLSLLANRSPSLAQAIGNAGLAGFGEYKEQGRHQEQQQQQERKAALDEKRVNAVVQRLNQQYEHSDRQLNLETQKAADAKLAREDATRLAGEREERARKEAERKQQHEERLAAEGKYSLVPGMGADETGKQVPGSYKLNQKTGESTFVPGLVQTPKGAATSAVATPAEEARREVAARRLIGGDIDALKNVGRGAQGDAELKAINGKAVQVLTDPQGEYRYTPQQAADYMSDANQAFRAGTTGKMTAARTAASREENLNLILKVTDAAVPAALEQSAQVWRSGFVPLNRVLQMGERATSNTPLALFRMANLQLAESWARAMNPTGVMRNEDREKALGILNEADSPETYRALVKQLQTQITRERDSIRAGENKRRPPPYAAGNPEGGVTEVAPREGDRKQFKQGWGIFHNNQWHPERAGTSP